MNRPAFIAYPQARDMEPAVSAAWRAADKLSLAKPGELAPHRMALIETMEKLEAAIALSGAKP